MQSWTWSFEISFRLLASLISPLREGRGASLSHPRTSVAEITATGAVTTVKTTGTRTSTSTSTMTTTDTLSRRVSSTANGHQHTRPPCAQRARGTGPELLKAARWERELLRMPRQWAK
ncbi:unnamed protein product [Durusdinium trenchii]|uniref:Secreted protein n=1 Tax=Durusdinium trenchii TaxID=1381693 RepID=A0ABP0S2T9_9DINO